MSRKRKCLVWGIITIIIFTILFCIFIVNKTVEEGEEYTLPPGKYLFNISFLTNKCKFGLEQKIAARGSASGCFYPMCSCYVCVKCGDGVCGKGENHCNCSIDCN